MTTRDRRNWTCQQEQEGRQLLDGTGVALHDVSPQPHCRGGQQNSTDPSDAAKPNSRWASGQVVCLTVTYAPVWTDS